MWQIPCAECECVYIGEIGKTLEKRLSEDKEAVKRNDTRMHEIAVHTWKTQHKVNWEVATVKQVETNYTQRRTVEAIHIISESKKYITSNLD